MALKDPIADPVRFIDERTSSAPLLRKGLRYLFPDHWSFLLGEVALYCFLVLIATGTYLALFYDPSTAKTVYHGAYAPLRGQEMSGAYQSVLNLSLQTQAGLLMRQTHHWAADLFMAVIVVHLMRVFFTGAFRKPRELTWLVGVGLLAISLLEGYMGYSLVDDLLSGIGLAIGYGVGLSIPIIGGPVMQGIFGGAFPGKTEFFSRMYIMHVFLIPGLIGGLIAIHLVLIAAKHHTQFKESARTTEKRIVGAPMFPAQVPRSLGLMFMVVGLLFLLGGLVQINPIWQWGPFEPWLSENGAQPDWYLGWLIGALRLMPSFDVTIGNYTLIPNPFWGGVAFPGVVFTLLAAFPWLERRFTRDHRVHNLANRPREAPNRTAFGVMLLSWVFLIFLFGAADRILVLWGLSYQLQLYLFRVGIWLVPAILFVVTRRWCLALQAAEQLEEGREVAEERARQRVASRPMGP
ncbi:MAG TPA: cytochrome b N-terminal domain-containing protein [Solirubrobacteraceae bacterium]|nr:cytochrome b N-terminal domain-containing protein [Solirubrobacteraceae bacterium]